MLGLGNILTKGGAVLGLPNKYSFNFDGSNDYLALSDSIGFTGAFSVSMWIYPDALSNETLLGTKASGNERMILESATVIDLRFADGTVTDITHGLTFTTGAWQHFAFVRNSSNVCTVYRNGSAGGTTGTLSGTFSPDAVGIANSTNYFNGKIDEVGIWDAELSASDIAKIASKPLNLSLASAYATDRTSNLKLWLRAGDKGQPEKNPSIARSDFYTDFDGTNDYVDIGDFDKASGGSGGTFTVMAWFKANTTGAWDTIVSKWNNSGTLREWLFRINDASKIEFRLFDESADETIGRYYNSALSTGVWYHYACTYDGSTGSNSNDGVKIYENGIKVDDTDISGIDEANFAGIENLGGSLQIGSLYDSAQANFFDGAMSSVSLYQTALDAQTIKQFAKSRFTPMRDNRFSVVDFDGSDDYIVVPHDDALNMGTGNFTLSAWIKQTNLDSNDVIMSKKGSNELGFYFRVHSTDKFFLQVSDGTNDYYDYSSTTLTLGKWHHVCVVWTQSDGVAKYYLDGVDAGSGGGTGSVSVTGTTDNTSELRIGKDSDSYTADNFIGSISSASAYNVAKSADEVYAIYQQGITYDESSLSGLVGYWRMGSGTGDAYPTIKDQSTNSNDGTITNGASDDIVQQMVAGYDMGAFESTGEELLSIYSRDFAGVAHGSDPTALAYIWAYGSPGEKVIDNERLKIVDSSNTGVYWNESGLTASKLYKITIDATGDVAGGGVYSGSISFTLSDGTFTGYKTGITTTGSIYLRANDNSSGTTYYDNLKVQEVLQSADLSDTYPAIIDVNEPVLGVELITNGTMEADSNWNNKNISGSDVNERSDAQSNSGTYSRHINIVEGANHGVQSDSLSVTTVTGNVYKLEFYLYRVSGNINAYVYEGDGSGYSLSTGALTSTADEWVKHTHYYVEGSGGSSASFQILVSSSTGRCYIDDVTVKEVQGNPGTMTNQASSDLVYSSVLPDQSFLTGVDSAYNYIDLDGSNEYIEFSPITTTGDVTCSAWVRTTDTSAVVVGGAGGDGGANSNFIYIADDLVYFMTGDSTFATLTFDASINNDQWNHIAVVKQTGSNVVGYLNGSLQSGVSYSATLSDTTAVKYIGRRDSGLYLTGYIGQTAIWNKALSASEVSAIYSLGRHANLLDKYSDNLVGYWAMSSLDASTGLSDVGNGTIYDRSGNSNHGTATNTEAADLASSPNADPNGYAKGDTNRSTTKP